MNSAFLISNLLPKSVTVAASVLFQPEALTCFFFSHTASLAPAGHSIPVSVFSRCLLYTGMQKEDSGREVLTAD